MAVDYIIKDTNPAFILSFTTHEKRFNSLPKFLQNINHQTIQPDLIVCNVTARNKTIVSDIFKNSHLNTEYSVNSVNNLGPAKKLIPTIVKYPDANIVTVDDDLIFRPTLLQELLYYHAKYPENVIADRVHEVTYRSNGSIKPYRLWKHELSGPTLATDNIFPTSGAGTLFPKNIFNRYFFELSKYVDLSFKTDDLWYFFMLRIAGKQARFTGGNRSLEYLPGTQENGLWSSGNQLHNEVNLSKLVQVYGDLANIFSNRTLILNHFSKDFQKSSIIKNNLKFTNKSQILIAAEVEIYDWLMMYSLYIINICKKFLKRFWYFLKPY